MTLTPSIKGQLTKASKANHETTAQRYAAIRAVFARIMPAQQAKHATKKYILAHSLTLSTVHGVAAGKVA